jgi:carbon monoxide dehydrogenase subunit G
VSDGFEVQEHVDAAPDNVWASLTRLDRAAAWMPGIEAMTQLDPGPIGLGTRFGFTARGKARETRITAFEAGRLMALTSTQGGVTATYTYSLAPSGRGTEVTLKAVCRASGLWRLLHPLIVVAMKRSDSGQLKNLKIAIENQ